MSTGDLVLYSHRPVPFELPSRDAELLAVCAGLRLQQAEWQRLWAACPDEPKGGLEDKALDRYTTMVWPGTRRGQGAKPDLVVRLLNLRAITCEGRQAKAAALVAMEDAYRYVDIDICGRDDDCELQMSALRDCAGEARISVGEDAELIDREQGCLGAEKAAAEHETRLAYADTHGDDDPPVWARPHWSHRIPPSNDKAEMTLLGALMVNNLAFRRMGHFLQARHFADPVHGAIFERIQQRIEADQMADVVTLTATFEHTGELDEVGGTAYLRQLLTAEVAIIDVHAYAQSIADAWLRRQTIEIAEQIVIVATLAHRHALGDTRGQLPLSGPDLAGGLIARMRESIERLQDHVDAISEVVL